MSAPVCRNTLFVVLVGLSPVVPLAERNQVVESEDEPEFEGAGLDGGDVGEDDDVSGVEPDSLFAGVFSDPLPAPSLAWLSLCFAWLGSFSLFE